MKEKYGWNNPWVSGKVNCPYCGTSQTSECVFETCFYCKKQFFIGVDGIAEKMPEKNESNIITNETNGI